MRQGVKENITESASSGTLGKGPWIGVRHLQILLLFCALLVNMQLRINVSVAVVAMTHSEASNPDYAPFEWTQRHRSYIVSSYYWGSVMSFFPSGLICKHFGVKWPLLIATFAGAVFSAITPYSVLRGGWQAYCIIRFLTGLFQGLIFPCVHEHVAKWSLPKERNLFGAFAYSGADSGTIFAMSVGGIIASSSLGWPGISYVSAGICLTWCLLWTLLGANNAPSAHFISKAEKLYIESALRHDENFHQIKIPTPWRAIFTSKPFYASLSVVCAYQWVLSTSQIQVPSYLDGVLKLDIKSNGLYSSLPYVAMFVSAYGFLIAAELLTKHKIVTLTVLRKSFNTIAFWGSTIALCSFAYLNENQLIWAVVLATLQSGCNAATTIGSTLNVIDLSPNHAAVLTSITNNIAYIFPLMEPLFVGVVVSDTSDRYQWRIIFIFSGLLCFVSNLIYIIWGTTATQAWNAEDFLSKKSTKNQTKNSADAIETIAL